MGRTVSRLGKPPTIPVSLAALWVASLAFPGCGGGGGNPEGSPSKELTPLEGTLKITGHDPACGAVQVPVDAAIQITFDAPIHQGSVASGQIVLCAEDGIPLLGIFSAQAGHRTVSFTPSKPFTEATDYTLTVDTFVFDTHYRTLARPYTFRFRSLDNDPPVVEAHSPTGGAQEVCPKAWLEATFSEELARESVNSASIKLRDWNGQSVPSRIVFEGHRMRLLPLADLRGNRNYTFSVRAGPQGVKDRSGNPLEQDLRVSFQTGRDTTAPEFLASLPERGSQGLAPSGLIRVTFDDSIDPWSVEPTAVLLLGEHGGQIPITLHWSQDRRTVVLEPQVLLTAQTSYLAAFPGGLAGIANMSGVSLASTLHVAFRTGTDDGPFRVESLHPGDQQVGVAINAVLEVRFNRPLSEATVTNETVRLLHQGQELELELETTLAPDGRTLFIRPAETLPTSAELLLVLGGGRFGLLSDHNRPLPAGVEARFTTTADDSIAEVCLYPPSGTRQVPRNSTFVALFSQPIDSSSATSTSIQLVDLSTLAPIPGTLSIEMEGRAVRFTPTQALTYGQHLEFKVEGGRTGLKNRTGNWIGDTRRASLIIGYQVDTTPPLTYLRLNEIPEPLAEGMQLAPFGFTLDISGFDPGDAAIDPTSLRLQIEGPASRPPSSALLLSRVRVLSQGELSIRVPPALAFGTGEVRFRASLADLSGNRSMEASASAVVAALTDAARPLERNQIVYVDFTTDREGKGRGDGVADWYQDLLDYGLVAQGDPIGKNAFMLETLEEGVLAKANTLFGRDPDGTPRQGSIAVLCLRRRPPSGIPFMHMAMGGQDPEGGQRSIGQESTGVLGRAWFDLKNSNFATNNTGTSPGLGVFPGELFLYQANLYQALYPGYVTTFGRRFRLLSPHLGGTPAGTHPEDPVVLDPDFDFTTASAAQRSRYLAVFQAADDLAVALGALLAHEAGHSLGLVATGKPPQGLWGDTSLHNQFGQPQDLMNAVVGYDALVEEVYRFRAFNRAYLREQILMR